MAVSFLVVKKHHLVTIQSRLGMAALKETVLLTVMSWGQALGLMDILADETLAWRWSG